jgi:phospholipid transport system transporter-binding protein
MNKAAPEASVRNDTGGTFELAALASGRFAARGPLTFATARQAREQGLRSLASASGRELEVDCAGITAPDSAGLAVLLDWLGAMQRAGRALRYTHLPAGLMALARISEVEELLERGVQVP